MSSSGLLSRFCSLVPKQKLQMGMGSATGWQVSREKKVETVSQLNGFTVQMSQRVLVCPASGCVF